MLLTAWWTFGVANLVYAIAAHRSWPHGLSRRVRLGLASVLLVWFVVLVFIGSRTPRTGPYGGIDTSRYLALTCAEFLAAPSAQQMGWAAYDQGIRLDLATTDQARANIKSWSVEEWMGGIKDACVEDPTLRTFTSP